ncbi:ABC transporter ATP-binding protein [Ruminococcus sp. 5_1_39BFAA]|uniref:ABC transporter ATP-binding protein n=1 Tax=Ruminococcus sp. 5_1_39BFAA TaxID=457412 RepID=UPI0035677560
MEILKCDGIRKVYGSGENQVTALDRIDLSVDKGEFVAIVGASGSGKSTLLHILGSVDQPTEGKVIVEGTDISTMNRTQSAIFRRRKVGLVYQFYNLIPTLTIRKNILMPLLLDKRKPNQEYFEQVVNTLGIADKLDFLPDQLSGGQQQRAAIARSLIYRPVLLLADDCEIIGLTRKNPIKSRVLPC